MTKQLFAVLAFLCFVQIGQAQVQSCTGSVVALNQIEDFILGDPLPTSEDCTCTTSETSCTFLTIINIPEDIDETGCTLVVEPAESSIDGFYQAMDMSCSMLAENTDGSEIRIPISEVSGAFEFFLCQPTSINQGIVISNAYLESCCQTPDVTIEGDKEVCADVPVRYEVDGEEAGYTYNWLVSIGVTVVDGGTANDNFIEVYWTTSGNINVEVTNPDYGGCTGDASISVTVNETVTADAGNYPPVFTSGRNITLTGTPQNTNGTWTGVGVINNGDGTASFNPNVTGTGSIKVTYSYETVDGCRSVDETTIVVTDLDDVEPTYLGCGDSFYDTGGSTHRYTNETTVTIICPDDPSEVVTVDFQYFEVAWDDMLKAFDGNSPNAPQIDPNSGMGPSVEDSPGDGIVTASCDNVTGCLTFVFCVDDNGFGAGWFATIECNEREDTEFDCSDLENMYKIAECNEDEITLEIPIPYHIICDKTTDVRITSSCSDYIGGLPADGTVAGTGNGTLSLTFPLGIHTLTFSSTAIDSDNFECTIQVRALASRLRCKAEPVVTTWDHCYAHIEPQNILEGDCLYDNDETDVEFTYNVEIEGVDIVEYNDDGYPIIDITNVDCGSSYKVIITRSYVLDWNCNGDPSDDQPLEDECESFVTIEDYVTPIIENGPDIVEIPCYDDPGEQAIFAIGTAGGQVIGGLTGGIYVIPGIDDIEVTDNCEHDLAIGDWEYEAADCTLEPLETNAPVFHYYQRKIVVVDQCGNRHTFKQRVAIVAPTIYPPISTYEADCTLDLDHLALVNAWYEWVAEGRPADDPRANYALYVPVFDPTPNVDGTSDASGDEIPVAPNDASNDFPNCGYNVTFEDTTTPGACAGSKEIWRNWNVFNWCQGDGNQSTNYHQLINVGDGYPPHFEGEPVTVFTPYDNDPDCKGEITFWHPNVVDACGGNVFATITYNGVEKSFVGGPVTFHNVMSGTTINVTFNATDECEDEAEMDFEVEISGSGTPVINCPGIQSIYLGEDCEAVLDVFHLSQESYAACGTLTADIALASSDSDGDGFPEDEDYSDQIVFTDADLANCQQTGFDVVLRFTDSDGNHYYCDVEVWLKVEGDFDDSISCADINPYVIYAWDDMADDLARVGESDDPVAGFQRLMDSGGLGQSIWESSACLGNTWIEIIDVDYFEFYGDCPGGKICYKFKIRNDCGYTSDICTNCVIIDGDVDWTMNFPPDYMVEDGMIPQPATIDDIMVNNNDSWWMEVVVETVEVQECSRKLVYNYYLTNHCTWDNRDECAAIVGRPDGMTDGVVLRYRSNENGTGNSIDDGNEALDNDGYDVTARDDDGDFVRVPPACFPHGAQVYQERSNISNVVEDCVSAHEYGFIHYQQMVIVDNGESSIPIIQVLNLGPFCDTDLEQDDDGYCLVPVEISACIEFGCSDGSLSDFSVMLKPFGEGEGIADSYGTLVILDEKTCAVRGNYPLDPNRSVTQHVLIVTDGVYQFEIPFIVEDCTPAVISLDDIGPFCGGDITNPYGGCSADVDIRASFDFGCGSGNIQDYDIKLKPFGEGPAITDPYGEVFYIDATHLSIQGEYPLDPHNHITEHVLVISHSGYTVELPFKVKDCTPPTVDCYNWIVEGEKLVHLTAKQLDNGSSDLCTDYNDLQFFFADPLEHPDSTECTFHCVDGENGIIPYTLWVMDEWGNSAACQGSIIIQDYDCSDEGDDDDSDTGSDEDNSGGAAAIAGNISMEDGSMIEDVEVNLTGGMETNMMTGSDGHFMFEEVPTNKEYVTRPYRNDKAINGVTTYDLVFMSRHILGTRLFSSPYDMIAADVNGSGSITTFDIVILRKLILGQSEDFGRNTSWRFIPKNYEFPDPSNPWAEEFPEEISINTLADNMMENDFIGVKVGDVNSSAIANLTNGNVESRTSGQVFFHADNLDLKAGVTYTIPFYLEESADITGYQFGLEFDLNKVELLDIEEGIVSMEHFGTKTMETGLVSTSWNTNEKVDFSKPMFYAVVRSKANTKFSKVITINTSRLSAEAYSTSDELYDVLLGFNGSMEQGLKIYQNIPNPFKDFTMLSFFLPETSEVTVEVLNTSGQLLKTYQYQLSKGNHQVNIDLTGLPEEGLFYYQLRSNKETVTGRMVRIQE